MGSDFRALWLICDEWHLYCHRRRIRWGRGRDWDGYNCKIRRPLFRVGVFFWCKYEFFAERKEMNYFKASGGCADVGFWEPRGLAKMWKSPKKGWSSAKNCNNRRDVASVQMMPCDIGRRGGDANKRAAMTFINYHFRICLSSHSNRHFRAVGKTSEDGGWWCCYNYLIYSVTKKTRGSFEFAEHFRASIYIFFL